LHIAIKRNYTDVVDLLLAAGSRHDIYNHQGETAAFDAVATNKIEVIRLMIVHNCDLEQPGKYFSNGIYKSLFQIAAEKGHFEICRLLATFVYVDFTARVHICLKLTNIWGDNSTLYHKHHSLKNSKRSTFKYNLFVVDFFYKHKVF
jgi:ankyrin repeat protein